ncbi:MAG: class I SAM-dependent methyltransferase [Deltaproteobacteria bacterium]|nr:class I SAM-dependent methyltransferase [Deltaproteobacteria bacterium]
MTLAAEQGAVEEVACAVCGGTDATRLFEKDGFPIVRCRGCGLVYVNPRLTPQALAGLYEGQEISPAAYYVRTARQDELSFAQRLALIERYHDPGTLLDLGCGPGTFSAVARSRGWHPVGLDVNSQSVAHCRDLGLEAICDVFPSPALSGRRFDVVVMNDFLEHLPDPGAALEAAGTLLAPGGVLFVTTPDVGSLMARLTGVRWLHLKPNEHLNYFDRRTIDRLLTRTGYRVKYLRAIGRVRNLAVALEKMRAYGELASTVARLLIPVRLAERINLPLNPGDEMVVIAAKAD